MDACAKIYINDDYSVEVYKEDIEEIADDVRAALYDKPRPADYNVADILTQVNVRASGYIKACIWMDVHTSYCIGDLCKKQRTKEHYWNIIKMVLEQIEVIAK